MRKSFFKGNARLHINGLNLDKFLNNLIKNDIKIYDYEREEHKSMTFSVSYKHREKVFALAAERQYNITEISSFGLFSTFAWAKRRVALLIAFAGIAAALLLFNSFVWEVRITGLDAIALSDIQNAISEAGIGGVNSKSGIDRINLENKILSEVPGVSYVNVYTKGITLFIDIVEALPKEAAESRQPRDLYAQAEGIITRVVTISGTAAVKIGDKVTAGQILISRTVTYPDGSGAEVRADGEVYAQVEYEGEAAFFGAAEDFEKSLEILKEKALERASALLPQGSCLIDTRYDIIDTVTGKIVRAVLLVERRIDS